MSTQTYTSSQAAQAAIADSIEELIQAGCLPTTNQYAVAGIFDELLISIESVRRINTYTIDTTPEALLIAISNNTLTQNRRTGDWSLTV